MAALALISALIHLGGQKAMCDNDWGATYIHMHTNKTTQTRAFPQETKNALLPKAATHNVVERCLDINSVTHRTPTRQNRIILVIAEWSQL